MFVRDQDKRGFFALCSIACWTGFVAFIPATFVSAAADEKPAATGVPADASVETLFADFLHYARIGHFTAADAYARALLAHPNLDPVKVEEAANRDPKSLQTLLIIIKNSSIGDSAAKVLALVEQGEHLKRKDAALIQANIEKLGGDPQQELFATRHLAESGEYAIPPMVRTLLDPARSRLWPRVVQALPKMGQSAIGPLVMALTVHDTKVRLNLIHALGEIGYPQAIPYLLSVAVDEQSSADVKQAAWNALKRIETITGRSFPGSPEEHFFRLGEQFYEENDAVRADPRLDTANVWYWDASTQILTSVVVPTKIFGQVMAMRCAGEALRLRSDYAEATALWLAANVRREGRLGMNVESGDPGAAGEPDPTQPKVFPRALYFTQAAGPRYVHLMLDRAIDDGDSTVALGAIEALNVTAGEASLLGAEFDRPPLARALLFPDLVVRIRASLALGAALPRTVFTDSHLVIPTLAQALNQSGREQVLVVDPDPVNLNRVVGALRAGGREVIGEGNLYRALDRARTEFPSISGLIVSADIAEPQLGPGLAQLRGEYLFAKTPVVVLAGARHPGLAEELSQTDQYVETVDATAEDAAVSAALQRVRTRAGHAALDPKLALSVALESAETLRRIAADGRTVYDVRAAGSALIGALSAANEELQTRAASVLALLPTPTAQRAVAHVAMDPGHPVSLRIAVFGSLAESAKNHGLMLEPAQVTELVRISRDEPDLTIRTAASQALGAVNLQTNQASDIIRSYHGG